MKKRTLVLWISIFILAGCLCLFAKKYHMDQMISEVAETIFDEFEWIWKQKMNMESTPEHYAYYYEQMNAEDQQRYRQLLYVIQQHGKNLNVSVMDMETIERIFQYILLDNPELFYVDNLETQTITVANVKSMMTVATIENMDMKKQSGAQKTIDEFRDDFLEQISETMGEEEKAELAFSYVVEQLKYVADAPYNQTLYSAALGETVCMGYTAAYKYLCDQIGIPCISVIGTQQGGDHAWNMIYLDHMWHQVDCTQGDALVVQPPKIDYRWFKRKSKEMNQTHVLKNPELLPACR